MNIFIILIHLYLWIKATPYCCSLQLIHLFYVANVDPDHQYLCSQDLHLSPTVNPKYLHLNPQYLRDALEKDSKPFGRDVCCPLACQQWLDDQETHMQPHPKCPAKGSSCIYIPVTNMKGWLSMWVSRMNSFAFKVYYIHSSWTT